MGSLLKLFENCGEEIEAKVPGKTPGFLRFGDVAEPVEVWYNRVKEYLKQETTIPQESNSEMTNNEDCTIVIFDRDGKADHQYRVFSRSFPRNTR